MARIRPVPALKILRPKGIRVIISPVPSYAATPVGLEDLTVDNWTVNNYTAAQANAHITASATGDVDTAYADVTGTVGVASIVATLSDGSTISIDKKWAEIYNTTIDPAQSVPVVWSEQNKSFSATATVNDSVVGLFTDKDGSLN